VVIVFFLFGLVIGSFLNVCITRIPEDVSIILPGSRCPKCGTAIKVYDNVPVFAWIWLGGKCRACGTPISVMYPLVELATGLLFAAAFLEYGVAQATVKWLFFTCLIIVLTITDLRMRLLPDLVTWPGFAVGLMFSWFVRRARLAVFSPAFATAFGRASRWNPGSGLWKFSPVGTGGRLQIGAQA